MALNFEPHTMNTTTHLANQNILEWESRLQHIDAMAARANELHGKAPAGSEEHQKLAEIRTYREQLSQHLENAQQASPTGAPHASHPEGGVESALEATGLQLERILGSVLGVDAPRRRKMDQVD